MACKNCFKGNVDSFMKATCQFYSRRSLVIFLLNVVLNVKDLWEHYCFCNKVGVLTCSICQFQTVYLNDEYNIYENSFDINFLSNFHRHVYKNLKCLLLETDCHIRAIWSIKSIFMFTKIGLTEAWSDFIYLTVWTFMKIEKWIKLKTMISK